jgi:HAD superfamily hydrolase (TIGR01509 family)
MQSPRGALLDIDGTLIDSNDAHARSWVAALAERDIHVRWEEVRRLIGMGGDKLLPAISGIDADSPDGVRIAERRGEIFRERHLPYLAPFPEARDLLLRMKADGLTLVAASSAKADELGALLAIAGARDLLQGATSSDDAARSKPDPDIVQEAIRRSGHPADALVMLGDTPYDVEAARRAGVRIVAFRCGGWDDDGLRGAAAIYDGPADLLSRYDGSILARG